MRQKCAYNRISAKSHAGCQGSKIMEAVRYPIFRLLTCRPERSRETYYISNKNTCFRLRRTPPRLFVCALALILIFIIKLSIHLRHSFDQYMYMPPDKPPHHQNENRGQGRQAAQKAVKSPLHLKIALVDWASHLERAICRERKYSPRRSRLSQL